MFDLLQVDRPIAGFPFTVSDYTDATKEYNGKQRTYRPEASVNGQGQPLNVEP